MAIRVHAPSWLGLAAAALTAAGCEATTEETGTATTAAKVPQINTLSNRADMISGGDALVEIVLPDGGTPEQLRVTLNDKDVRAQFAVRANGRIIGQVTGMAEGPNILSAALGGGHGSYLVITNHKIGGPVISGPQVTPWICATPTATTGSGDTPSTNASGLSTTATDDQCNIATEARLFYRTTAACSPLVNPDPVPFPATPPAGTCFKPYNPATPPTDLAMTTTDAGVTMPFIVRIERGTLNRGIYDIAVLFDPTKDDVKTGWKPVAPQAGWNGKVLYAFGASAGQPRLQFHSEVSWADSTVGTNAFALGKGFLVAVNSLTDSLYNSNRVLMSETVMMMKEKIIDTYGEVRYVIGNGCSGGSIGQLTTASIFPGLLDGIQPTCTYPDAETTGIEVSDCALLVNFYASQPWKDLENGKTQAEINVRKAAINGHVDQTGCHAWVNSFAGLGQPGNYVPIGVVDNDTGLLGPIGAMRNNCRLPASMVYDPVNKPDGVRCTGADHAVAIYGKVKGTNRANTISDNVGVQYGLKAFLSAAITAEEFVTLNEKIGGFNADSNPIAGRSQADPDGLAAVYRAGIVSDGHHLARLPILDLRGYDDTNDPVKLPPPLQPFGIHHVWRSFALRARLDAANANHANHVMWRFQPVLVAVASPDVATAGLSLQAFTTMDQWLGAMKADTTAMALEQKVVVHRPTAAFDFCNKLSDATHSVQVTDSAVCDTDPLLKPHASPRQIAGGPLAENILKCQLRPINRADYNPVTLTDAQFNRLKAVFPDGVCDFTRSGVGQQDAVGPLDFSAGPGGVPFPDPPQMKAF
jgi:hypothetical protein